MSALQRIALALVVVGAINWGLIGFFNFDLVASIFGGQNALMSRIIYGIVGLSGLVSLATLFKPMDEVKDAEVVSNRRNINNLNYNSEFGKEPDFQKPQNMPKKKTNGNKNGNTSMKKK